MPPSAIIPVSPVTPALARKERARILNLTVSVFIREFCDPNDFREPNRLLQIAVKLESCASADLPRHRSRGKATIADLLGEPDRPLIFEDPSREILGFWREHGRPAAAWIVLRLKGLGIKPSQNGFSGLPMRVKRALRRSDIGNGHPTRADIEAFYDANGVEGLRRALHHRGAAFPHYEIARWLGHPVVSAERTTLEAKIAVLRKQLSAAKAKLASLD